MAVVTRMSLGPGAAGEVQMDRAETARSAWEVSERQMDIWLDEWWAAHGAAIESIIRCASCRAILLGALLITHRRWP